MVSHLLDFSDEVSCSPLAIDFIQCSSTSSAEQRLLNTPSLLP